MTDEQIVIALAEKVMGWEVKDASNEKVVRDPRWGSVLVNCRADGPGVFAGFKLADWTPLQSISDAWMIVERMKKLGIKVHLTQWTFRRSADSMPRAICLAALGALGVGE